MKIKSDVSGHILKPISEVYQAIIQTDHLSGYFITRASKNQMTEGEEIIWYFDDFCAELPIQVKQMLLDEKIVFTWEASGINAEVSILLKSKEENQTDIQIIESEWNLNEQGVKMAMQQTQGWTDFICCLKAYLYTGVNLRNGEIK